MIPARDDTGTGGSGLQQYAPRAVVTDDLVRDRGADDGDLDHILLRVLHRFADRVRDLGGFAETVPDVTVPVADDHQRGETRHAPALDGLGNAVQCDKLFLKVKRCRIKSFCHWKSP